MTVPDWFKERLGWKQATKKATPRCERFFGVDRGPNLADLSGSSSTRIAGAVYEVLNVPKNKVVDFDLGAVEAAKEGSAVAVASGEAQAFSQEAQAAGTQLELGLAADLSGSLYDRTPDFDAAAWPRRWFVTRQGEASQFTQYQHLADLQKLLLEEPTLRTAVGRDYQVKTDVMIGVPSQWAGSAEYTLHAAVSSKLTIRSDRAQNIRVEFGTLVRNRRGRLPHLVVVTAEPLPSRIISIARGTGEIDAIYHLLFDEMNEAIDLVAAESSSLKKQAADWREMVEMKRVRPYSELPDVLALG